MTNTLAEIAEAIRERRIVVPTGEGENTRLWFNVNKRWEVQIHKASGYSPIGWVRWYRISDTIARDRITGWLMEWVESRCRKQDPPWEMEITFHACSTPPDWSVVVRRPWNLPDIEVYAPVFLAALWQAYNKLEAPQEKEGE